MLSQDIITETRCHYLVSGVSICTITRSLNLSRPAVREHLHTTVNRIYVRQSLPAPKLGAFRGMLESWLKTEQS